MWAPVHRHLKFSAVFGTTSANKWKTMRLDALLPIWTSKNTRGFADFDLLIKPAEERAWVRTGVLGCWGRVQVRSDQNRSDKLVGSR